MMRLRLRDFKRLRPQPYMLMSVQWELNPRIFSLHDAKLASLISYCFNLLKKKTLSLSLPSLSPSLLFFLPLSPFPSPLMNNQVFLHDDRHSNT